MSDQPQLTECKETGAMNAKETVEGRLRDAPAFQPTTLSASRRPLITSIPCLYLQRLNTEQPEGKKVKPKTVNLPNTKKYSSDQSEQWA